MKHKLRLTALLIAAACHTSAPAAVLNYAGTQFDLGSGWRTSANSKPLDVDGDNILGTDGYQLVNRPPVLPAYLSAAAMLIGTYPGNANYALLDDPTNAPNTFRSGTLSYQPGTGVSVDLFQFTLNASALGRVIRVGLLVDNLDGANWNATSFSLVQTNGAGTTNGPVATTATALNNLVPDWVFFDITGGVAGDVFIIRGVAGINGAATLGGVAFDSTTSLVTSPADDGPGSLRQTIAGAPSGGWVLFAPHLSGATILLTNGQILLNKNLTLDGSALPGGLTLNANRASRVLEANNGTKVLLRSLSISNGYAGGGGGGGGILAHGTLTLDGVSVLGNFAAYGGGIYQDNGLLVVSNSLVANNTGYDCGGVYNWAGSCVAVNSTITGNSATNWAGSGGGGVRSGGGFKCYVGSSVLLNTTIAGNAASDFGGGINNFGGTLAVSNSIVAGNLAPASTNLAGVFSGGYNVIDQPPLLSPLANYGGRTQTMPPLLGSPAIDAGAPTALATDQRGFPRLVGPAADLGAVEFFVTNSVVTTNTDGGLGSLRFAIDHGNPAGSNSVAFANNLAGQTILLTNGQLYLNKSFTVDASALASPVVLNGNHASRILYVETNVVVVLNSLVLSNGLAAGMNGTNGVGGSSRGGDGAPAFGGGIYNAGNLTLNQTTLGGCAVVGGSGGVGLGALPGVGAPGFGGGIYNAASLTLNQTTLAGNTATGGAGGLGFGFPGREGSVGLGGGIYNGGTLTLNNTTLTGGSANGGAGGPGQSAPGGNARAGQGGGIYNAGTLTLNRSTLAGSAANGGAGGGGIYPPFGLSYRAGGQGAGGAVYNSGTLTANQSTIANATAAGGAGGRDFNNVYPGDGGDGLGGGVFNAGAFTLNQSTVSGNVTTNGLGATGSSNNGTDGVSQGGGIYSANTFALFNSIVAGNAALNKTNTASSNLLGTFTATGNNLTNGNPLLSALGSHGGLTPTLLPQAGSPAIDAGSDTATNAPYNFTTDQRGLSRLSGFHVDLGAAELQFGTPTITALGITVTGTNPANGTAIVQLAAAVNPNGEAPTSVSFQYGLTPAYAATNGPALLPVMSPPYHATNITAPTALSPGYTYHWNARAFNSLYSAATPDQTFHLAPPGLPGDQNGNGLVSQAELDAVYAAYLPTSPWLFMTNVAGLGGTNVTFALEGSPLGAYTVEFTTNLTDWLPIGPATPRYGFTDTNAPAQPQRHYRLRYP